VVPTAGDEFAHFRESGTNGMRDIAVTLAVFGSLPFILRRPWIGIIVWTWLGFMNPHRMAWGFSTTMPFAYIVAVTTLVAMLFSNESKRMPWTRESIILLCFVVWMCITTLFAVYPELAQEQLIKVLKIQLMIFVAMMLITTRQRLHALVLTIAISIGFYGFKGGIFTIINGGAYRVQGPSGTFIEGNNELGLALAMTVPLLYYCARHAGNRWLRWGLILAMVLNVVAAIGTQSRGALLGMAAMGVMFWLKAKQKFAIAIYAGIAILLVASVMPDAWYERMNTIQTYEQDGSAMGRVNAWWMAWNLAKARPIVGGGFETFRREMFQLYAPDPSNVRDVHSIYFQVLGHHGFVGLGLFLALALLTWHSASRLKHASKVIPEMRWLGELAAMVQVSMIAYATAGAFLGLAYFDYYYNLVVIIVVGQAILKRHLLHSAATSNVAGLEGSPNGGIGVPHTEAAR
jgi:probable O-glycosylation ligase (exosortase A-associated)